MYSLLYCLALLSVYYPTILLASRPTVHYLLWLCFALYCDSSPCTFYVCMCVCVCVCVWERERERERERESVCSLLTRKHGLPLPAHVSCVCVLSFLCVVVCCPGIIWHRNVFLYCLPRRNETYIVGCWCRKNRQLIKWKILMELFLGQQEDEEEEKEVKKIFRCVSS